MISNNEDSFIFAGEEDIRFWVLKVPQLKTERPNIEDAFLEELPAFLSYLNRRKLATTKQGRMWFHQQLIKTEAFQKVIEGSRSSIEKELRLFMKDKFLDFGIDKLYMTRLDIHTDCFKNRFDAAYIEKILKEKMKLDLFHRLDHTNLVDGQPTKKYVTVRYSYPRWEEVYRDDKKQMVRVEKSGTGRPYVFLRSDFLTDDEIRMNEVDVQAVFESALATGPHPVNGNGYSIDSPF